MKITPRLSSTLAILGTAAITLLLLRGCNLEWRFLPSVACKLNGFFVSEALNAKLAAFIVFLCMLPGLFITLLAFALNKLCPARLAEFRGRIKNGESYSLCTILSFKKIREWGLPVYSLILLYVLLDLLSIKAGSAVTGVVLGVVLDLHFFWQQQYFLLLMCSCIAYLVAIFPRYIYWRMTR